MKRQWTKVAWAALTAIALAPQAAQAAGTAAGTTISNTVTLNFAVNGSNQTPITSAAASFVVDRKVDVTVATTDAAAVTVLPGSTNQVLTFQVTNLGNATQDFILSAVAVANGGATKFGGTDSLDMLNVRVFVESGVTPGFQPAEDTATFVDELAADGTATVYVVADTPATAANAAIASYHLVAQAALGGTAGTLGAAETQTPAANQTLAGVDVVFADGAGSNDAARDGKHSDQSDYQVNSAVISVTKSVAVADPYGGTAAIPGATATYTITISNDPAAGASATLNTIVDNLNAALAPVTTPNAASWSVTGSTRAVTTGQLTLDLNDAGGDGLGYTVPGGGGPATVTFNLGTILAADAANGYAAGELKPGESVTLTFKATIQ